MKNGIVTSIRLYHFTSESSRKESDCDRTEQGTGKIPKNLARIYNDLFERRQEGDYIDFVRFQESQVLPWISKAEQLIGFIISLVEKEIS